MIILKTFVRAGSSHPSHPAGLEAQANVFFDSMDWSEAETKAATRLQELGWDSLTVKESVRLPEEPDLSSWTPQLREAFNLAQDIGVALVVYPASAT